MPKLPLSFLKRAAFALLLVSVACVDPYLKTFTSNTDIFIVDAVLTNSTSGNYVYLLESSTGDGSVSTFLPVSGADVRVLINDTETVSLNEVKSGYFLFPDGFRGETGNSYKLQFTAKGQEFESKTQILPEENKIQNVYHEFFPEGLKDIEGKVSPSQRIYVDFQDPADSKDYYMWDWTLYEEQFWCKTCTDGYYYRDASTPPLGECREIRFRRGKYDYNCDSRCWDIIKNEKVNILKDDFSNGQLVQGRLAAEIPIYQLIGSLIEIRQLKINKSTYDYLNLVQSQGQNTGGLADTPPASLAGNVSSTSDINQPVAGFFIVGSVDTKMYWLDKTDVPAGTSFIGLLGDGRRPNPEPASMDTTRPPMAPCTDSPERTKTKPLGWIN